MAKVLKGCKLSESQIEDIQSVADTRFDGNFTAAIELLSKIGADVLSIEEDVRWGLYSGIKKSMPRAASDDKLMRKIVDALYI